MSLGVLLDVTLSVMALMAVMSLAATAISEFLADNIMNMRGSNLRQVVRRLLELHLQDAGPAKVEQACDAFFRTPQIRMCMERGTRLGNWLPGRQGGRGGLRLPSALESSRYAQAMIEILAEQAKAQPAAGPVAGGVPRDRLVGDDTAPLAARINGMLQALGTTYDAKMAALQAEYDEIMARATGWYLRRIRTALFVIGLVLAAGANIDLLHYAERQMTEADLASLGAAISLVERYQGPLPAAGLTTASLADSHDRIASFDGTTAEFLAALGELGVGVGWHCREGQSLGSGIGLCPSGQGIDPPSVSQILGWLIIAFGVTLGAQFWFDLFRKLVGLRTAGATRDAGGKPVTATG